MNYIVVSRGDSLSKSVEINIENELNKLNFKKIDLNNISSLNKNNIDYVFSIGGDGTFLRSVQKFYEFNPLFITINTGNFGYLCKYKKEDYLKIFADLKKRNINYKEVSLLKCEIYKENIKKDEYYAVNEFRLHSSNGSTLKFDISIDDTFFETLKGDGCLIASSIGSSGIAKSLKGALIDNEIELLEFIENAPISNNGYTSLSSPFVLSKEKVFKFSLFSSSHFNIYFDSEMVEINEFNDKDFIKIYLSNKKIRLLENDEKNYIARTSSMFIR